MSRPPNILFIMADQHNARCTGYEGHPDVRTPNLDNLVGDGVAFRRAYTCKAECMPSRMSFFTGLYTHCHGITGNIDSEIPDYPSIVEQLRTEAGYRTGAVGKWHIGDWKTCGFEDRVLAAGNRWGNAYQQYLAEKCLEPAKLDKRRCDAGCTGLTYEDSQTVWGARQTMTMIDRLAESDKPFFLWSSYSPPHNPYAVPVDNPFPYDPEEITLPPDDSRLYRMKPLSWRRGNENVWTREAVGEAKFREALANYYSLISMVDDAVGMTVAHLEKRGLLENTIIVYTADHGDFAGEHAMMGKNTPGPYEPLYRIPFVWYWKGRFGMDHVYNLTEVVDFYPTICELAGLPIPRHCQGESLARRLLGSGSAWGFRQPRRRKVFFDEPFVKTVRTLDRKLAFVADGENYGELYDLEKDPYESHNLYNDPAYRQDRLELTEALLDWKIRCEQPVHWAKISGYPETPFRWFRKATT